MRSSQVSSTLFKPINIRRVIRKNLFIFLSCYYHMSLDKTVAMKGEVLKVLKLDITDSFNLF